MRQVSARDRAHDGTLVWYAAYGSNLHRPRFERYLTGGAADGAARGHPGARDPSPPRDDVPFTAPGTVRFGWESPTWRHPDGSPGGIAFYEPRPGPGDGVVLARAYLLTAAQFSDVAAQEMHLDPDVGTDLDLARVLAVGVHTRGPGRYETLHHLGRLDGVPVLTFSCPPGAGPPANRPTDAYLALMAAGLVASHGLSPDEAADHLARLVAGPPDGSRPQVDAVPRDHRG